MTWTANDFTYAQDSASTYCVTGFSESGLEKFVTDTNVILPAKDSEDNIITKVGSTETTDSNFSNKHYTSLSFESNNSYTELGEGVFSNIVLDSDLHLPDGLVTIKENSFSGSNLKNLILPDTVTDVGEGTFQGATIKTISWSKQALTFNRSVFKNCTLEHIYKSYYVTTYAENSFYGLTGLSYLSTFWDNSELLPNRTDDHGISKSLDVDPRFYDTLFMNWETQFIGSRAFSNSSFKGDFTSPKSAIFDGEAWFDKTSIDTFNFSYNSRSLNNDSSLATSTKLINETIRIIPNYYDTSGTAKFIQSDGAGSPCYNDFFFGSQIGIISDIRYKFINYTPRTYTAIKSLNFIKEYINTGLTSTGTKYTIIRDPNNLEKELIFDVNSFSYSTSETGYAYNSRGPACLSKNIYILSGYKANIASFATNDYTTGINIHYRTFRGSSIPNQYYTSTPASTVKLTDFGALNNICIDMTRDAFYRIDKDAFNIQNLFTNSTEDNFLGSTSIYQGVDLSVIGKRPYKKVLIDATGRESDLTLSEGAFKHSKTDVEFILDKFSGTIYFGEKSFYNCMISELNFDTTDTEPARLEGKVNISFNGSEVFAENYPLTAVYFKDSVTNFPTTTFKRTKSSDYENVAVFTHSRLNTNHIPNGPSYVVDPGYIIHHIDRDTNTELVDRVAYSGVIQTNIEVPAKKIDSYIPLTLSKEITSNHSPSSKGGYLSGLQVVCLYYKKDELIYVPITTELVSSKADYVTKMPDYFDSLNEEVLSKATTVTQHIAKGTHSLQVPLQAPLYLNLNLEKYLGTNRNKPYHLMMILFDQTKELDKLTADMRNGSYHSEVTFQRRDFDGSTNIAYMDVMLKDSPGSTLSSMVFRGGTTVEFSLKPTNNQNLNLTILGFLVGVQKPNQGPHDKELPLPSYKDVIYFINEQPENMNLVDTIIKHVRKKLTHKLPPKFGSNPNHLLDLSPVTVKEGTKGYPYLLSEYTHGTTKEVVESPNMVTPFYVSDIKNLEQVIDKSHTLSLLLLEYHGGVSSYKEISPKNSNDKIGMVTQDAVLRTPSTITNKTTPSSIPPFNIDGELFPINNPLDFVTNIKGLPWFWKVELLNKY